MRYFLFSIVLFLLSCNNSSGDATAANEDSITSEKDEQNVDNSLSGCYRQLVGRDTIDLRLNQSGNSLTGTLSFDNFEKDASSGTVKGEVVNNQAVLWYDFDSEGMHSVMEIIYQPDEGGLVRAVGDMRTQGDTALFTDRTSIRFDRGQTLKKVECSEL
jgi:hypothetical protein